MATLAIGVSGCDWPRRLLPAPPPPPKLDFQHVTLRRLGCLGGTCPQYSVSIDDQGQVRYNGQSNVAITGKHQGVAAPQALDTLRTLLAKPEFYWMPDQFLPTHAHCRDWTLNDGAIIIYVKSTHLEKRITLYLGCRNAPLLLKRIEAAIDVAAGDAVWTGTTTSGSGGSKDAADTRTTPAK